MLQAVRLKNFVKFHEDCNLSFRDGGAYFFVGQNGSGKSSVLEAIRRCLSRDSNTSFSRIPDESKPSYIICEYEIPDPSLFSDRHTIFTSFLYIPDTASSYSYAKIVLLVGTNDTNEVFIEFINRENGGHDMKHCTCSFQDEKEQNLRKEICKYLRLCTKENDSNDANIISLLAYLKELLNAKREDTGTVETADEKSEVEKILKTLEKRLVFTFSLRSLGPLQWSKSRLINKSKRKENYLFAREKCEVINYFLSSENSKEYDSQKEGEIFRMLTDQANYSFDLEDGLVSIKLDGEGVEFLKLSEGILEAKYLSLLLASKEFFTVLLEEPDRGMHPQMIQIIRDIVLPLVKDKTIIIVSHNPVLISSWSIPRTYKFYKERDGDKWISRMIPVKRVAQEGQHKIPRLLASEDYVSMIFARNVIFVEGQSDFYFVKALVAHILTPSNDTSMQKVLQLALSEEKTDPQQFPNSEVGKVTKSNEYSEYKLSQFRNFLASLQVVKMNGKNNTQKWKYVSGELGLSGLFLLDRDAVVEVPKNDSCILATDEDKRDIKRFVKEAIKKRKVEVKSRNTQQSPKSQNTQELHEVKRDAIKTNIQQSLTEVMELEQGKQKANTVHNIQENSDLAKLKTDVPEAMTYNFCNQKNTAKEGTKDEDMESKFLETARVKMKEVIQEIVSSIDSYESLIKDYLEYFCFVYKDLLDKNSDKIPKSTILSPLKKDFGVVSPKLKSSFVYFVETNKWLEACECLEKGGVFVWRTGNLEDAFMDLVINFECAKSRKYAELLKRNMKFVQLGIHLNLTKFSTRNQTKLFMDNKVSDESIKESIITAFDLCGKNSDITQFIRFLVRAQTFGLSSNIEK